MYVNQQDGIIRQNLATWLEAAATHPGQPLEMRGLVRDMNASTSQQVFVGECSGGQIWRWVPGR